MMAVTSWKNLVRPLDDEERRHAIGLLEDAKIAIRTNGLGSRAAALAAIDAVLSMLGKTS